MTEAATLSPAAKASATANSGAEGAADHSEQSMNTLTVERGYGLIWEGDRPAIAKAYVAAQKSMEAIKKAAKNEHFKTKYADLAEVVEAVVPALNEHGIGVIQNAVNDGEWVSITTTLLHEGGSSVSSTLRLRPSKTDPQGVGSTITYGRRYSLLAMTGAAPEDDDGNASSGPREQQQHREPDFPSAAAQFAADQLRQCKTKGEFTHFWESQKTGLREALDDGNFAHVIGVMRTEARRFADAPANSSTDETPFDQKEAA
ncbi:ERF family protein [Brevundimonas nasdae]|uniref:ERF family protein n=1 Tax=Brevundimonas nasdae TaxID=172043 RepID=UPI00289EE920|nr:ERF family protein [Brevundimonas nasdae]